MLCDAFENVVGSIGTGNGGGAISAKGVVVDDGVAVDEAGMTVADPIVDPSAAEDNRKVQHPWR